MTFFWRCLFQSISTILTFSEFISILVCLKLIIYIGANTIVVSSMATAVKDPVHLGKLTP